MEDQHRHDRQGGGAAGASREGKAQERARRDAKATRAHRTERRVRHVATLIICAFVALACIRAGVLLSTARQQQSQAEEQADQAEASLQELQEELALSETQKGAWTLKCSQSFLESDGWQEMQDAVNEFLAHDGYRCGVVVEDLSSGATATYNGDEVFYPASSIKAPYLCSLFQTEVETGEASLSSLEDAAANIIIYSDNDAYDATWDAYGPDCLASWARDAGVSDDAIANIEAHTYPRMSVKDMSLLWEKIYAYLSEGSDAANMLAGYLDEPETTAIGTVAEKDGRTSWSKAGWFPDNEGNASPTTADCGVIFSDEGPYLVCVFSSAPVDFESLTTLIGRLDEAEPDLVPGHAASADAAADATA